MMLFIYIEPLLETLMFDVWWFLIVQFDVCATVSNHVIIMTDVRMYSEFVRCFVSKYSVVCADAIFPSSSNGRCSNFISNG